MSLGILQHGIVHRRDDGVVSIHRPARTDRSGVELGVARDLADDLRLSSGDIVAGQSEPIPDSDRDGEEYPPEAAERLVDPASVNGLSLAEAAERPSPRKRGRYDRSAPDRCIRVATGSFDFTGRALDFAAPLGVGCAGVVYGPHGSGLTRTLRAVVDGATRCAPDLLVFVLLLRARSEEATEWRRRFPLAEVIVCPSGQSGAAPEEAVRTADLVLECAQRQTELGRDVLLAVDSLTGLWGSLLEMEEADAQLEADQSLSRQRVREWVQHAGSFGGEGLLGSGLGGSLTLVGTAWHTNIDLEVEEELETHPHLRLMEHILHETNWRIPLSGELARERLFPAIDPIRCYAQYEENLLQSGMLDRLRSARAALARLSPLDRHHMLMNALDRSEDADSLLEQLVTEPGEGQWPTMPI